MGAAASIGGGVANLISFNAESVTGYRRHHRWGDKLLRKLTGDELQQHLAEQPYINPHHRKSHARGSRRKSRSSHAHEAAVIPDVSDDTYQKGHLWVVPGVGEFAHRVVYTFEGNTLPIGLTASDNDEQQGSATLPFRFTAENVSVSSGTLNLKVPGGQDGLTGPVECAEVTTDITDIFHASVRVTAKLSQEAGVCQGCGNLSIKWHHIEVALTCATVVRLGNFFYRNENTELDMEYITDPASGSHHTKQENGQVWYSSQSHVAGRPSLHRLIDPPSTMGDFHKYRLDWNADSTAYYINGKLQSRMTDNVPNQSGTWVWNNWSNGDPAWSCGPPQNDSIFQIKEITMYYNTLRPHPPS